MPETKTIAILANSQRSNQRCVAGKQLVRSGDDWEPGTWIRFADPSTKEGEVPWVRTRYEGGGHAEVLDIAQVDFDQSANDPDHPEDWILSPGCQWRKIGKLTFDDLTRLADRPATLWNDASGVRSVTGGFVKQMPQPFTLALVESPPDSKVRWWREQVYDANNAGGSFVKTRERLSLRFPKQYHEFDITDPLFRLRHQTAATAVMNDETTLILPPPFFVCLSLTKPFKGKHYKVAATIFEPHA